MEGKGFCKFLRGNKIVRSFFAYCSIQVMLCYQIGDSKIKFISFKIKGPLFEFTKFPLVNFFVLKNIKGKKQLLTINIETFSFSGMKTVNICTLKC